VGRVRGATLGELRGRTFHAYESGRPGICGERNGRSGSFFDATQHEGRTLVYGRARGGARSVTAVVGGKPYTTRTGIGGAFVFVFGPRAAVSSLAVR
jgi:hypothetical protein